MSGTKGLLKYNCQSFLTHILSMEEHSAGLTEKEVAHSWCQNKHGLLASGHHLAEFVSHCARDPECKSKVLPKAEDFKRRFDTEILEPIVGEGKPVEVQKLAAFRNEWREIAGVLFPHLAKTEGGCPICDLDQSSQMAWLEKKAGEKASA